MSHDPSKFQWFHSAGAQVLKTWWLLGHLPLSSMSRLWHKVSPTVHLLRPAWLTNSCGFVGITLSHLRVTKSLLMLPSQNLRQHTPFTLALPSTSPCFIMRSSTVQTGMHHPSFISPTCVHSLHVSPTHILHSCLTPGNTSHLPASHSLAHPCPTLISTSHPPSVPLSP